MRGIAYRRHTEERAKARARRKLKARWTWTPPEGRPADFVAAQVGMMAATRAPCSCFACGNPRRHFGELLMGERRALERFRSEIREIPDHTISMMEITC